MDPSKVKIPPMKDLTIDNITENTILTNSQGPNARLTFLLEELVKKLHDFARETRLSTEEWMAALNFLVRVGQISSDVRHVSIIDPQRDPFQTYLVTRSFEKRQAVQFVSSIRG